MLCVGILYLLGMRNVSRFLVCSPGARLGVEGSLCQCRAHARSTTASKPTQTPDGASLRVNLFSGRASLWANDKNVAQSPNPVNWRRGKDQGGSIWRRGRWIFAQLNQSKAADPGGGLLLVVKFYPSAICPRRAPHLNPEQLYDHAIHVSF